MLKILLIAVVLVGVVFVAMSCKKDSSYSIERMLLTAHQKITAVERPLTFVPNLDLNGAYKIQDKILTSLKKPWAAWAGYKISPKEVADETFPGGKAPVFGRVVESWVKKSGAEILLSDFVRPFMENEIAFVFKDDVPVGKIKTKEDLLPYIKGVAPAIEFPDIRYTGEIKDITSIDLVADNAVVGNIILGEVVPLDQLDVDSLRVVLKKNGEPVDVGSAIKPSGSQWDIVLWLMGELSKRGKPMKAGWFVITGAMGSFMSATPGEYVATYGDLGEISYSVK